AGEDQGSRHEAESRRILADPKHEGREEIDCDTHTKQNDGSGDGLGFTLGAHAAAPLISARMSSSRRFCFPSTSKFSGNSHCSKAAFSRGHSRSIIENHAVSRLAPLEITCWRKTPSNVKP